MEGLTENMVVMHPVVRSPHLLEGTVENMVVAHSVARGSHPVEELTESLMMVRRTTGPYLPLHLPDKIPMNSRQN